MNTYFESDVEFIEHLYNKESPTDDDLEAASRMETNAHYYAGLIEQIHTQAKAAMAVAPCPQIAHILRMTGPFVDRVPRVMN